MVTTSPESDLKSVPDHIQTNSKLNTFSENHENKPSEPKSKPCKSHK